MASVGGFLQIVDKGLGPTQEWSPGGSVPTMPVVLEPVDYYTTSLAATTDSYNHMAQSSRVALYKQQLTGFASCSWMR